MDGWMEEIDGWMDGRYRWMDGWERRELLVLNI